MEIQGKLSDYKPVHLTLFDQITTKNLRFKVGFEIHRRMSSIRYEIILQANQFPELRILLKWGK